MAALISCLASCSAVKLDNCVADASQFWGPNRTFSTRRATMAGLPPVSCFMNGQKPVVDKAIIVGGGLGGLSAAIQLRKIGIDAHVYDKYQRISGGEGTMISIFPNGSKVLYLADPIILDKMKEAGKTDMPSFGITPLGDRVSEWSLSSHMEEKYGQPLIAILWQDALRILSDALPNDCKHTGYDCFDISQEEEGAIAHFRKGDETVSIKAPLVIGADGIHSTVRSVLFGAIKPRDNGRTMWRAVIDGNLCSHEALTIGSFAALQNGRTTFIINGVQGKLYWAFSVTDESTKGEAKIRSKNPKEAKERLLKYYEGWDIATHIIQATEPEIILERRVLDVPVLSKWSCGHIVLLGDAAHAVTPAYGQGANLAFEDGMELAKQLALTIGSLASLQNGHTTFIINGVQQKLYWAFSVTDESTNGEAKIRSRNPEEAKERLLKYFEGWDIATHLIQATDPELILERRVLDVPVLSKWSCGHVVLLGDAAHAVTPSYGQGANLAFEDGMELAKQLATSTDLRSALEAYEKARLPRATIISEQSQSLGVRPTDEFYNWLYTAVPDV